MDKSVFNYLKKLQKNNDREWFALHKTEFENAKEKVHLLFNEIHQKINQFDEIEPLKIYRIYRDIRFSNDKTPYKNHFGANIQRKKPQHRGGFYIHIEPGNSYIGGGFWNPEPADLLRIRQEINHDDEIVNILNNKKLKETFGEMYGEQLKTAPKGFDKTHERLPLLQLKQFLFSKKFSDDEVMHPDFSNNVANAYQTLLPFYHYMTEILTTNANGE